MTVFEQSAIKGMIVEALEIVEALRNDEASDDALEQLYSKLFFAKVWLDDVYTDKAK